MVGAGGDVIAGSGAAVFYCLFLAYGMDDAAGRGLIF